ncbi:hypothetical protein CYMTET_52149 [Cymbomonas tetramitiformis]|uniref:Uncharacterized protein n=1 Tax=Cymbomonas tetramitiformis TaxID=36881 RepID=A0AAE0ERD6_9CHLO|nr:hypothetical protein CYMTET_52149 [Cymbomonas tetramitiformis]
MATAGILSDEGLLVLLGSFDEKFEKVLHQEEYSALRYPAHVDPRPILAKEHLGPAVLTAACVRARLDPEFYSAVRDRYQLPPDLLDVTFKMLALLVTTAVYTNWAAARQGEVAGTATAAAIPTGEDSEAKQLLKIVIDNIRVSEYYIKNQKSGALAAPRGSLHGYRPGMEKGAAKPVAFDPQEQRAMPRVLQVYPQVAGDGPDAFSEVCEMNGGAQKQEERDGLLDELGGISERLTGGAHVHHGLDCRCAPQDAPGEVVPQARAVLQDAGAAGCRCPERRGFVPVCAFAMPLDGAGALTHAATRGECGTDSSDDDDAVEVDRARQPLGCGPHPFGLVPWRAAFPGDLDYAPVFLHACSRGGSVLECAAGCYSSCQFIIFSIEIAISILQYGMAVVLVSSDLSET